MLNSLKISAGESVAVFGTGAVGMAAIMASRIAGAQPIIGVDIIPTRLALAAQLGAGHTIDNRAGGVRSRISAITGGRVANGSR